jgi:hypothetical protein
MTTKTLNIFLEDYDILPWVRPTDRRQNPILGALDGQTTLVRQIEDLALIDETIGQYRVLGSAIRYEADIRLCTGRFTESKPYTNPALRKVLFSGGLTIYEQGNIPGTEIQGFDLLKRGKIWVATEVEDKYIGLDGLKNLILGEDPSPTRRIQEIMQGYQTRKEKRRERESAARHKSWERGKRTGQSGRSVPPFW